MVKPYKDSDGFHATDSCPLIGPTYHAVLTEGLPRFPTSHCYYTLLLDYFLQKFFLYLNYTFLSEKYPQKLQLKNP